MSRQISFGQFDNLTPTFIYVERRDIGFRSSPLAVAIVRTFAKQLDFNCTIGSVTGLIYTDNWEYQFPLLPDAWMYQFVWATRRYAQPSLIFVTEDDLLYRILKFTTNNCLNAPNHSHGRPNLRIFDERPRKTA